MQCETEIAGLPNLLSVFARLQSFEDLHPVDAIGCKNALYSRATRIMLSEYPWSSGMERRLENTLLLLSNHPLQFHAAQVVFDKVELSSICRRFLVESF